MNENRGLFKYHHIHYTNSSPKYLANMINPTRSIQLEKKDVYLFNYWTQFLKLS